MTGYQTTSHIMYGDMAYCDNLVDDILQELINVDRV